MSTPIEIEIDDARVLAALHDLANSMLDPSPALSLIGEKLVESTKRRFETTSDPDNNEWAANSPVTVAKKGFDWALKGEDTLADSIVWQLDGDGLSVGSPMKYAAMQQFGGTKAEFPWLWGDIPSRPFLGVSADDRDVVLDILRDYLLGSV